MGTGKLNSHTEIAVRLVCFASVLLVMAMWQWLAPRRELSVNRPWRWGSNLAIVVLNGVLVRFIVPITAVSASIFASSRGWGLLNVLDWPVWLEGLIAIVLLDLAIYVQHVLFHAVPWLWRLHMVHHADLDFDVTTGVRFHTLEILISAVIKLAVVLAIGPAPVAVVIFEVVLNATSMFNHSNVYLPERIDRILRWVVVTPDIHRVHHSIIRRETDSNFGFNLPWWDYLFRTYIAQPQDGHEKMTIGIPHYRNEKRTQRLWGMLTLPLRRKDE